MRANEGGRLVQTRGVKGCYPPCCTYPNCFRTSLVLLTAKPVEGTSLHCSRIRGVSKYSASTFFSMFHAGPCSAPPLAATEGSRHCQRHPHRRKRHASPARLGHTAVSASA